MGRDTAIAWADHTFNIAWGCNKISAGCDNCYAEALAIKRGFEVWGPEAPRRTFGERHWKQPFAWNRAAAKESQSVRVFACSMCDVFDNHPTITGERERLWQVIRKTPWLDWQLVTKRPRNMAAMLPADWGDGWPNVWLGVTVESNKQVGRARTLVTIPAVVHFISYEPALGPLDALDLADVEWVIYGGESGPGRRQDDTQWARDMRDRCKAARVAFFYKQSSAYRTEMGIELDGEIVREFPQERRWLT